MNHSYIKAILAIALWGTLSSVSKLLLNNHLSEMEVLFFTSILAAGILSAINICNGKLKVIREYQLKDWVILSLLGLLGTFIYNLLYNVALARLSAQEATIINYLWPIMIVIFSCFVLGEKFTLRKIIAVLISFFGIIVLVTKLDFTSLHLDSTTGVLAAIGAGVSYGLFSVYNKKYAYDQTVAVCVFYIVSALVAGGMMLLNHDYVPLRGGVTIMAMLWLGLMANGIAYLLWCNALVSGNTSKISNMAYATPFLSIMFSHLLLGEPLSIYSFLGLGFILLGIAIQLGEKTKDA